MNWYKKATKEKCTGWIAVRFDSTISKKVQDWGKENIPNEDVYSKDDKGRETDTHITVVYGLCTEDHKIVKQILSGTKPIKATMKKVGFFKNNDDFDVVIVKMESKDLEDLNNERLLKTYKKHGWEIEYVEDIFQGESDPPGKGLRIRKPEKKQEVDLSVASKKTNFENLDIGN